MLIPEEKISEILHASDIIEVISDSVNLKKSGKNYVGLCPFHSENTPSFSVSPQKQMFHCFGCSAGGNIFSFLMKQHFISFPEAVTMLAKRYGIDIKFRDISPFEKKQLEQKERLFRLNTKVKEHYAAQLHSSPSAAFARQYLEKRAIHPDIINEFGIGYAPDKWDNIVSLFKKMKLGTDIAEESGLVVKKKNALENSGILENGYYDRFRNRIIFPIFDVNMQVAGFGGRVIDNKTPQSSTLQSSTPQSSTPQSSTQDSMAEYSTQKDVPLKYEKPKYEKSKYSTPKYLNSPETPVYSKGKILYGLHAAKQHCRQKGSVYIVEGYFDFISLYQSGIKNCVATLGTALTIDHIYLLKRYVPKIFLVFDSDDAGVKAAKKSVELFYKEGLQLFIIILPTGHDPDSFVSQYGPEAFESAALKAMSIIEFLTEMAIKKYGLSVEGKVSILDEIKNYLLAIQDNTAKSLYIKNTAKRLEIDEVVVIERVTQTEQIADKGIYISNIENNFTTISNKENTAVSKNQNIVVPKGLSKERVPSILRESEPREKQILSIMLQFPEIIVEIKKAQVLDYFYSTRFKNIGSQILHVAESFYGNILNITDSPFTDSSFKDSPFTDSSFKDSPYVNSSQINNIGLVGDVMALIQNQADRELIASLAMIELADVENIMEKSFCLITRIINIKKRRDSTLTHQLKTIEQAKNLSNTNNQSNQSNFDIELLRQRQMEIRALQGYKLNQVVIK